MTASLADGDCVRAHEGHLRRRDVGCRSATCDGRIRVGVRLDTRIQAGQHRAVVAPRLPCDEWSARPMIVVAVDAHTGELVTFDRDRCRLRGRGHRRHRAAGFVSTIGSTAFTTSTVACAPGQRRPCLGLCERRRAVAVRRRSGTSPKVSSRGCATKGMGDGRGSGGGCTQATHSSSSPRTLIPNRNGHDQMDPATRIPSARTGLRKASRKRPLTLPDDLARIHGNIREEVERADVAWHGGCCSW